MAQILSLQQTQHLTLTPQLRQAIAVLQLSTVELSQTINQALEDNPFLEIDEPAETLSEAQEEERTLWDPESSEVDPFDFAESPLTLREYLLQQSGCLHLSDKDRFLLNWLIGSLDENGFLSADLCELADDASRNTQRNLAADDTGRNESRNSVSETTRNSSQDACRDATDQAISDEIDLGDWQVALSLLQSLDPPGIGARNYRESLLIQIRQRALNGSIGKTEADLAQRAVCDSLSLIAARHLSKLKRELGCSEEQASAVCALIASLTPRPASAFSQMRIHYVAPEIQVIYKSGIWKPFLLNGMIPALKINQLYAQAVSADKGKSLLKDRLHEAEELIKNIRQRRLTVLRVCEVIVKHQQNFFSQGPQAMVPLVLKQVADELGLHESTVSRVTSGKYLICPLGLFELKFFFSSRLGSQTEETGASATAVKEMIQQLVSSEDRGKPLSDAKLAALLQAKGIEIARRTVAKYREALNISPASLRKKL